MVISKVQSLNAYYRLGSWIPLVKSLSGECLRTPLRDSKYWFRHCQCSPRSMSPFGVTKPRIHKELKCCVHITHFSQRKPLLSHMANTKATDALWRLRSQVTGGRDIDRSLRADPRLAPSQWETSLQSNAVSHWLGANLESALSLLQSSSLSTRRFYVISFWQSMYTQPVRFCV